MKTFIAENVLEGYSSGLIVVKAQSRKKAIEIIKKEFDGHDFIDDCRDTEDCRSEYCLKHRVRELRDNEILSVWGSD